MKSTPSYLLAGAFCCLSGVAVADTNLANQSLAHIDTQYTLIQNPYSIKQRVNNPTLIPTQSSLDSLIATTRHLRNGAGLFGKNVSPIIGKDVVGLKYSLKW